MKDPLQAEETAYEILGVESGADHAEIDRAFREALKRGRKVQQLILARNVLHRPEERARLDLLHYPGAAAALSPSPLADPGALLPDRRAETAAAWEDHLRGSFPDLTAVHSLAVLWYWWSLHRHGSLVGLVRSGPVAGVEPLREALPVSWRRAIGYWTMLAGTPGFWRAQPGLHQDLVKSVLGAFVRSLGDRFQEFRLGCPEIAGEYAQLKLDLSREVSTAAAWARGGMRLRFRGVETPCGPLLLQRLGWLETVRRQVGEALAGNPADSQVRSLRELLSDQWPVFMALREKAPDAALEAIERLPGDQRASAVVPQLRARALLLKGREQASLGDFDGALETWEAALKCASAEVGDEIRTAVVEACRPRATALQAARRDEAIALLERAVALAGDEGLKQALSLRLLDRGIDGVNRYLEHLAAGAGLAEGEAQSVRNAVEDIRRASELDPGSSRAGEQLEVGEEVVRDLPLVECVSRHPRLRTLFQQAEQAGRDGRFDAAIGTLERALGLRVDEAYPGLCRRLSTYLNSRAVKAVDRAAEILKRPTPSHRKMSRQPSFLQRFGAAGAGLLGSHCAVCSRSIGFHENSYTWKLGDDQRVQLCVPCGRRAQGEERGKKEAAGKVLLEALADLRDAVELDPESRPARRNQAGVEDILASLDIAPPPRRKRRHTRVKEAVRPRRAREAGRGAGAIRAGLLYLLAASILYVITVTCAWTGPIIALILSCGALWLCGLAREARTAARKAGRATPWTTALATVGTPLALLLSAKPYLALWSSAGGPLDYAFLVWLGLCWLSIPLNVLVPGGPERTG